MNIVKINIKQITPYKNNAKIHTEEQIEQIKKSIEEFGMNDPIAVWGEDNIIVEGHGRLEALKQLGYTEVDCIRLDHLTDEERKAYTLAHNKLTMNTDFDFDILNEELEDITDIDMSDFGFDLDFEDEEKEVVEDEFDIDSNIPEEPKAKYGDIYQLGKHRLMCGDSTKEDDVRKLCNNNLIDLFLTDPPYNVDYTGKTADALKINNDKMKESDFRVFLKEAFRNANEVMKPGACFYIWHADSEGYNFRGACFDIGWKVRQCLIWRKNSLVMGRQDYQWQHEPCLYGWKDGASHLWASDRKQTTILDFDRPTRSAEHPTMKPISLFDYQIRNNTKGNDIVLDLFAGSGTTIIACEQNNRIAYGMELDPKYVDVIIKRYEDFTGRKAIKLN